MRLVHDNQFSQCPPEDLFSRHDNNLLRGGRAPRPSSLIFNRPLAGATYWTPYVMPSAGYRTDHPTVPSSRGGGGASSDEPPSPRSLFPSALSQRSTRLIRMRSGRGRIRRSSGSSAPGKTKVAACLLAHRRTHLSHDGDVLQPLCRPETPFPGDRCVQAIIRCFFFETACRT